MTQSEIDNLMRKAAEGNNDAFGELAAVMQDRLYRFALSLGLPPALAADTVQETLMRAYRSRKKWNSGRPASSWLLGITMNVVRECRRKRKRLEFGISKKVMNIVGDQGDPAEMMIKTENLLTVANQLEQLPTRQREAVTCRYIQQLSVRETAQIMGCTEGTVKTTTAAGLANLRKELEKHNDR